MYKTIIVIPAYNEEGYIGRFLDKLLAVTKSIVVVDDGSTDKTKAEIEKRGVKCLSHIVNLGKGAAIKTGCEYAFKKAGADSVIIMDGDDQHDPEDIKLFKKSLLDGNEIVFGVRKLDARMPFGRVLGNKLMSAFVALLFGRYIVDIFSGFKAFTKKAYKTIFWHSVGYEVETEIAVRIAKSKLAFAEVPINTVYHAKDYGFNLLDLGSILIKIPYWLWR